MIENYYVSIMNDDIGNIADLFDITIPEEKQIIEERKRDKSYVVLSLENSIEYMKKHKNKKYCLFGIPQEICKFIEENY